MEVVVAVEYATKEALLGASDLTEKDVELPDIGLTVRIRALPAAYSNQAASEALVSKQVGRDQITSVDKGKMEELQVLHALIQPNLGSVDAVRQLSKQIGPSWAKLVEAIDEISGVDKEAIERTEARFQSRGGSANGTSVGGSDPRGEGDS